MPPPTPWSTRKVISCGRLVASPQRRRHREEEQREQEDALRAEAVAGPGRRRDPHCERDEVAEHDPFDVGEVAAEVVRHRLERDVDDGRIHDVDEQAGDEHGRDHPLVGQTVTQRSGGEHRATLG